MSETIKSERLYVVRPSVVVIDETEYSFRENMGKVYINLPSGNFLRYKKPLIKKSLQDLREARKDLVEKTDRTAVEEHLLKSIDSAILELDSIRKDKPTLTEYIQYSKYNDALNTVRKQKKENVNDVTHIVGFENNIKDTTIAVIRDRWLENFTTHEKYYQRITSHFCEGEKCVDVVENDKIPLLRYLWEKSSKDIPYNRQVEEFSLSLKPYFKHEEVIEILKEIKDSVSLIEQKPLSFIVKTRKKQPICVSYENTETAKIARFL